MDIPIDRYYNELNLKEILPLLEGMEYFIFYGTLLGIVREGRILEKDDDLDILINRKHLNELLKRFDNNDGSLVIKTEDPAPNYTDFFKQATCTRDDVPTFVDFYLYDDQIKPGFIVDRWNIHGRWQDPNMHILIPENIVFPLQKQDHKIYGEIFLPSKPTECLEFTYGKGWMHPRKKKREYIQLIKNNRPYIQYLK